MNKKEILRNMFGILQPINAVVPKNTHRIVFYSNLGFRDNVKALYDFCIENHLNKQYELICVCPDFEKFRQLGIPENVRFVGMIHGIEYFLTSKYFFYSFGKYPIIPSAKQVVINLWHGTPLKAIGFLNNNERHLKQNYFTYVLAASDYFVPVMSRCFEVTQDRVLVCGHARNDKMFHASKQLEEKFNFERYSKIFMWMPTYKKTRGREADTDYIQTETALPLFKTWQELRDLDDYFRELNSFCLIKLHPLQEWGESSMSETFTNIQFYSQKKFEEENLDLYELLHYADALITDYSSVYFDYLLLNRPIGFTIDDMNSYSNTRGFVFDNPLDYMPGMKIQKKEQFEEFIQKCVSNKDEYVELRESVCVTCNKYQDDKNAARILKLVGIKV